MSGETNVGSPAAARREAFGENYEPTVVDRFGVWLSARQIRRHAGSLQGKSVGDFGCGYNATFIRTVLGEISKAVLVDIALAGDLKAHAKVTAIEELLPGALSKIPSESLDIALCISALEHVWEPLQILRESHRIVRPGGACLFNVPSWRGKRWLEFSAFRLGWSPREEMNDHKAYYDVKDLWPMLVRAGFLPSNIRCFSHKFGLNTFAVCVR